MNNVIIYCPVCDVNHSNKCYVCGALPTYKHQPIPLCSVYCDVSERAEFQTINGIVNWLRGRAISAKAGSRMREAIIIELIANDIKSKEWKNY